MVIIHKTSLQGHRDSNEDKEIIAINMNGETQTKHKLNIYGVFDGHGGKGISKNLADNYTQYFMSLGRPKPVESKKIYQKHIVAVYKHIQTKLTKQFKNLSNNMGSAACTVIHYRKNGFDMIYVINLGDCRTVLCNKYDIGLPLSKDHKPSNYDETIRIQEMGGVITQMPGDDPRIEGLSLSRAFGDLDTKPFVSHIPEIFRYKLDPRDKF